jgi:hypothetical protein
MFVVVFKERSMLKKMHLEQCEIDLMGALGVENARHLSDIFCTVLNRFSWPRMLLKGN